MPQMGVSVTEGTITKWLKQVGDPIARDEPLLEISTDKVDTEVPSSAEGVVAQILVPEGATVEVGTVLAIIAPAGVEMAPPEPPPAAPAPAPPAAEQPALAPEPAIAPEPAMAAEQPASCAQSLRQLRNHPRRQLLRRPLPAVAVTSWGRRQRQDVRLTRRRTNRCGARDRSVRRARHGNRWASHQERHRVLHRVGRYGNPVANTCCFAGTRTRARPGASGARRRTRTARGYRLPLRLLPPRRSCRGCRRPLPRFRPLPRLPRPPPRRCQLLRLPRRRPRRRRHRARCSSR